MWEWLLERYAHFALRRTWVLVVLAVALSVASAFLVPRLTIVTSRSRLIAEDHPIQQRANRFQSEFGLNENLVVVASSPDRERARRFVGALSQALSQERAIVRSVFHRLDLRALEEKALLYVPLGALRSAERVFTSAALKLDELSKLGGLVELLSSVEEGMRKNLARHGGAGGAVGTEGAEPMLRAFAALFEELTHWVRDPNRKNIGEIDRLMRLGVFGEDSPFDKDGYLVGKDGKTHLTLVYPAKDDSAENFIEFTTLVRERARALAATIGGELDVGVTGMPASVADEMSTIQKDSTIISLAALAGIAILYVVAYGFSLRILWALAPILAGTLWTFGFASAAVGHLSLISSVFSAVLFGLGDDFGIHLMARFEEEWTSSGDARAALERTLRETGPGVVTGALTTAIAFYTTMLVEVEAFRELGLIAGTGLLLVMVAAFLLLPPLLLLWARLRVRRAARRHVPITSVPGLGLFQRILRGWVLRRPKLVLGVGALVTVVLVVQARGITFDYDFLRLLPQNSEAARYYHRLVETSKMSAEFNAIAVHSLAEVKAKGAELKRLSTVGRVDSVAALIPPELSPEILARRPRSRDEALLPFIPRKQEEKLKILRRLEPRIASLAPLTRHPTRVREEPLKDVTLRLAERFEEVLEIAPPALTKPAGKVVASLGRLRKALEENGKAGAERIGAFQEELFARVRDGLDFAKRAVRVVSPMTTEDLRRISGGLFDRLVGPYGRYALYVFPSGPIWEREFLGRFVEETSRVDPEVTGFPTNFHYFSEQIQAGFRWASVYAAIAIFVLLLVEFRNLWYALLAAMPLCVGTCWMLGLMGIFGLEYNLANIVALPLILGMGVEYGVETVHRFAESHATVPEKMLGTTSRAITIAGFTTLIGLGSMGLASHRGLASLGIILLCGIGGCLLAAVIILPATLELFSRRRARRAQVS